jgi:hypothetical protein
MRLVSAVLALVVLPSLVLACGPLPVRAQASLRLNEFLAAPGRDWNGDGAVSTRDDEWVEVVNVSGGTLDLSGFVLTDGDSLPRYAFSGTLAAGERALVTGGMSYDWEKATAHPAYGLSLGNTGDAVLLWQVAGADTVLVDACAYKAHEAAADRAVARVPDGTGEWMLMDALSPYTGTTPPTGTGCAPTPAAANACSLTPATRTTWGHLKTTYR